MSLPSRILTCALLLATSASAQTDAVPHDAANPVHWGPFWVAHANTDGLQAFSAFAQRFETVAGPSAVIARQGSHGFLLEEGGAVLAYSARRQATAPAPLEPGEVVQGLSGEGEVFYVRSTTSRGDLRFHAYSTQTGTWSTHDLGPDSPRVRRTQTTDQLLVLHYHPRGAGALHTIAAFGVRKGSWDVIDEVQEVVSLRSNGNVVGAEIVDNFQPRFYAFSAVHNVHALSEDLFESASLEVGYNIVFAKTFDGMGSWRGSAFSAYDPTWVASDRLRPTDEDAGVLIGDNWVALHDGLAADSTAWEAIGARPHEEWAPLGRAALVRTSSDSLILDDLGDRLFAFGGVAGGGWRTRTASGPFFSLSSTTYGTRFSLVLDADPDVHVFSPLRDAWAEEQTLPPGVNHYSGASVTSMRIPAARHRAYSARWNEWVEGPWLSDFEEFEADSLLAYYDNASGEVTVFDGRRNTFVDPVPGGGVFARDQIVLVEGVGSLSGYTADRGAWETYAKPGGPIAFPLVDGPRLRGRVAWVVDAERELVAIGATNDVHQWHDYPDGTEYHAFAEEGGVVAPTRVILSIRGDLGDRVRTYYAEQRRFNPLNLPMAFTGKGWLQHPVVRLSNTRLVRDPEVHLEFGLPTGPPANLQIWTQSLTDKASGLPTRWVAGDAPEPLCIF